MFQPGRNISTAPGVLRLRKYISRACRHDTACYTAVVLTAGGAYLNQLQGDVPLVELCHGLLRGGAVGGSVTDQVQVLLRGTTASTTFRPKTVDYSKAFVVVHS